MIWFESLTRELPFHTLEKWKEVYKKGWSKLLGFKINNVIYYSKKNVVVIYRVKKEWNTFLSNLTQFCLEKPKLMLSYYNKIDKMDKKIALFVKKKIRNREQLKKYLEEADKIFTRYCTLYLIKAYSNFAITDEVIKKQPILVKKARKMLYKAEWFTLSKSIIEKSSRILKLPTKNISSLSIKEILAYISDNKIDYELTKKRYDCFSWNLHKNKWYYSKDAEDYIKKLRKIKENIKKSNTIKGTTANKGSVTGKVVIVLSTDDFEKIKKGCIIVAHMTTPWYIPYLTKVKAIITDEGGMGCHAAIISREFGIPCIIGTKIATKVFKDGDLVEVDANKGVVKKIK